MGKLSDVQLFYDKDGQQTMDFSENKRDICWNCEKEFSTDPKYFMPKEKNQKQYLYCNHCGKINHL